jgi:hypothetical protein
MKENCRKVLLVFAAVCFALTATNIMLVLHLAEHDNDKNHNSENCPICQHGVINKNSAIPQSPPKVYQVNEILFATTYTSSFSPRIVKFQIPYLRAPPSVC